MDNAELERTIALSRRKPVRDAVLFWTILWGFLTVVVGFLIGDRVFENGLSFSGLAVVLVGSGTLAALLCGAYAVRMNGKVRAAKAMLRDLLNEDDVRRSS